jgi:hypothetical protein
MSAVCVPYNLKHSVLSIHFDALKLIKESDKDIGDGVLE